MKKYKNFLLLSATLLTSLSAPLAAANEQFSPSQLTAMTSEVSVQQPIPTDGYDQRSFRSA